MFRDRLELARAEHMDLDIVPHDEGNEMELTVLWKGKPVADRLVYVRGPQRFRQNLRTDRAGTVRFAVTAGYEVLAGDWQ